MDESERWTARTKGIRERVSDRYCEKLVAKAHQQAEIVGLVLEKHEAEKLSLRQSLKEVASEVVWPTFVN